MAANTILQLTFKRSDLKTTTMSIATPKAGLTVDAVNTAMAAIIAKNIFAPDNMALVSKVKAELVVTDTTAFSMS
ncbi:DUF2922 domain-containing protein [Acetobacterium malicum]|uniref:DUF2922 family protein n=1 Tax=Acetobacterium malicum TaxID=52692 RepID=A0ABR6YW52_9FIRM|nr:MULTISPECIES: DUF2922 domain-containing protein [Acetobacterium]MBC3899424.1 DUF2922 family protein [Acetobacterium malicum]